MKGLINYFIDRSLLVNLLTVMIILVGILSLFNLKRETFPDISFDIAILSTPYSGSSTEDVEKLVTISLERVLKGIDGIEELNALSFEGRSIITIKVDADSDIDEVVDDVKAATGFTIGGCAPIGHKMELPIVIDVSLKRFDALYAAAGHPHCVFPTTVGELKKLTGGIVSYNIAAPAD